MEGPGAPSGGSDGKADEGELARVAAPTLAPGYALKITSHVVTEDDEGERVVYDSLIDGYVESVTDEEGTSFVVVPCHIELPEADGRKPRVADETVRARGPITLPVVFSEGAEGRMLVSTETGALELGVSLDQPLLEELPSDEDDPRLVDHDEDGEVGITIDLDGWEIYLAARARLWLAGSLDEESGAFSGNADLSIDVQIYGDDIPFVDVRSRVEGDESSDAEVVEVNNGFAMTPLDETPVGCNQLEH
jgi:hypothetical protein